MKFGSRETLRAIPRKSVDVEFPEYECVYRLRELSGTERDRFEVAAFKETPDGKRVVDPLYLRARLVASCLVGEDGKRLYADEYIAELSDDIPASVLGRLFEAAQHLNGLDAAATDTALKNSDSAPAGASPSA